MDSTERDRRLREQLKDFLRRNEFKESEESKESERSEGSKVFHRANQNSLDTSANGEATIAAEVTAKVKAHDARQHREPDFVPTPLPEVSERNCQMDDSEPIHMDNNKPPVVAQVQKTEILTVYPAPTLLEALERGWSIIPVGADKKALVAWKEFQTRRATPEEVAAWEEHLKPAGWAIVTGELSDRMCLDFDGEAGCATLKKLGLRPHRRTPSDGYHVDSLWPGRPVPTLNAKSKRELGEHWPGMDIRGDGGYVIFRGVTKRGQYQWLSDPDDDAGGMDSGFWEDLFSFLWPAQAPAKKPPAAPKTKTNGSRVAADKLLRQALGKVGTQGRNDAGFGLAVQLRDNNYSESEALRVMYDYVARVPATNTKGQSEHYTDTDARASLEQAYRRGPREPWTASQRDDWQTGPHGEVLYDVPPPPPPEPEAVSGQSTSQPAEIEWRELLILGKKGKQGEKGKPLAILHNVITALTYGDEWYQLFRFNEFSLEVVTQRETPWKKPVGSVWTDGDDSRAAAWLQREEGILAGSKLVAEAVQVVARDRSFHPVREKLEKLEWDGKPRLDTWLIAYLGAPDTPYVRAVGPRWVISAVARVYRPGCQADHVLTLEGLQGIKKSTALRRLVGDEWFADRLSNLGDKDSMMEVRGKWVIEMSELPNLRGASLERFKAFITSRFDRFREPYGRRVIEHPRQCVLAASTNSNEPFVDPTGTRRMWPVRCGEIKLELLERDADQLLGEACHRWRQGEPWWLETSQLEELATKEQDERYEPGVWDEIVLDWIEDPAQRETLEGYGQSQTQVPVTPWDSSEPGKVTIADILIHGVGKDADRLTQPDRNQVARCLAHAKWERKQDRTRGPQRGKRFYYRPTEG